ncbi:MAG: type I-B CRISPR-associated protein Cas5 [Firmicutes bacterium]|nr:type I-B CRISPR-associated protein Cas5 [Bacillota bacterium]
MALVFDVSADLALFRKPYTTTSMISYPFPPPTAVAGIIGAIVGIPNGSDDDAKNALFWNHLSGTRIAVGINKPVEWMVTAVNLLKYKTANADMKEHIQIKHQFVKKPSYRLYVSEGEVYKSLKERLKNGEFVFTPYLGVAYALADINYIGEYEEEGVEEEFIEVSTVVPQYQVEIDVLKSGGVYRETVPYRLSTTRSMEESVRVFYPVFTHHLTEKPELIIKERGQLLITKVGAEKVAWFNAW